MFKWIKHLLVAATVIVAASAPASAFALIRDTAGGSAEIQSQPLIVASAPAATASSSQGFQWGDAGVGAAGVLVLFGAGAGVASVMRHRRMHRPVTG